MPVINVRPTPVRLRLACVGLGALAAFGALAAAPARADETVGQYAFENALAICDRLDQDPNGPGITGLMAQLVANGLTLDQAAAVIVLAVNNVCPRYMPLLAAFGSRGAGHVPSGSTVSQTFVA